MALVRRMKVLDIFSGIGGMSLGLERAGMRTVGFCEVDPACRFWLRANYPDTPILGNIHSVTKVRLQRNGIETIDLIAGGFPCQPHSVAGKRKGQEDERHLWPEFARLVREIRPRWVLAENVPGIRTTAADEVLADLEAAGYSCWPLVVGADNVGAPHRRKRVWFVGRLRLADTDRQREQDADELRRGERSGRTGEADAGRGSSGVANSDDLRELQPQGCKHNERGRTGNESEGVGNPGCHGCQGLGGGGNTGASSIHDARSASTGTTWPARPGEPQHEWEAPRMAYPTEQGLTSRPRNTGARRETIGPQCVGRTGQHATGDTQPRMGVSVDGLPPRLARGGAASRRARLKALGNAVVPQVAEAIGRAILSMDRRTR